jgi:hypothetical protein
MTSNNFVGRAFRRRKRLLKEPEFKRKTFSER